MCGARTRHGTRCLYPVPAGRKRCRYHGAYAGAKDPWKGLALARGGRRRWVERLHALGLKAPGGRVPGRKKVDAMVERAVAVVDQLLEHLPAMGEDLRSDAEKSSGELLTEGMRAGLIVGRDIVRSYDPNADIKERRLVAETAGWIAKLGVRIAEADMRARGSQEGVLRVLEALQAADGDTKEQSGNVQQIP